LWGGFQNLWGDSEETTDNTENEKILQQEASNGDLFTEHDDEMAEDKAKYNFAFFMILFVFGTTGVYYIFTTVKSKFFPQSKVSEYLQNKRWRYWDRSQVRFLYLVKTAIGVFSKKRSGVKLSNFCQILTLAGQMKNFLSALILLKMAERSEASRQNISYFYRRASRF